MRWIALPVLLCALGGQPGARLSVSVRVQAGGAQLDDAAVEVAPVLGSGWRFARTAAAKCRTERGVCTFNNLPAGQFTVTVGKTGYFDAADPLEPKIVETLSLENGQRTELDFELTPGGRIAGTVYTESGERVAQSLLRARPFQPDPLRVPLRRWTYTDGQGNFSLEDLPPGQYGVYIVPPEDLRKRGLRRSEVTGEESGFAVQNFHQGMEELQWITPVTVEPGQELAHRTVVLRRWKVYRLRGALTDALTKQPMSEARVSLVSDDALHETLFAPRPVNPGGTFEFPSLAPGEYQLLVYRPGFETPWAVPVQVRETGTPELALAVPGWIDVQAEVRMRRLPPESASARLILEPVAGTPPVSAPVREPGVLSFGRLPPGRYRLFFEAQEQFFIAEAPSAEGDLRANDLVLLEGADEKRFQTFIGSDGGAIDGLLVDGEAEPVTRGWAVLVPLDPILRRRGAFNRMVRVDGRGQFRITAIAPGRYRLIGLPARPSPGLTSAAFWTRHEQHGFDLPVQERDRIPIRVPVTP